MKNIVFLLALLITSPWSKAQVPDSLWKKLAGNEPDTQKVRTLYKIGRSYRFTKFDSALFFADKAKALSTKINYSYGLLMYNNEIGAVYNQMNKADTALLLFKEGLVQSQQAKHAAMQSYYLTNIGNWFNNHDGYDSSVAYYIQALAVMETNNDTNGLIDLYGNLGALFNRMNQHSKAITYFNKSQQLIDAGKGQKKQQVLLYTNFSGTYANINKWDSVYYFANKAIAACEAEKNFYASKSVCIGNILVALVYQKRYIEIGKYVALLDSMAKDLNTPEFRARRYYGHAVMHYYNGNAAKAKEQALLSLALADSISLHAYKMNNYLMLTKIETRLGNLAAADQYEFKRDSIARKDTDEDMARMAGTLEKKYETQKKDNEILRLDAANNKKALLNKIFAGTALAFLLLGLLLYRNMRHKQMLVKKEQQLQQQRINELEKDKQLVAIDAMLKGQEEERSRIAKDLHDGLGGLLSGTKMSLINMKENLILTPENASLFEKSMSMLDTTMADLRKVAHNLLPEALVKYGLADALKDFCYKMQTSSGIDILYQQLGIQKQYSNTAAVFIYRIVQECVNNAVKHAGATEILVQLAVAENSTSITVEDNGKGYNKNDANFKAGSGLQNIEYRVKYFAGSYDVATAPGQGTSVNIQLKA
jgi:two-component system, NarL family, sensor kinase